MNNIMISNKSIKTLSKLSSVSKDYIYCVIACKYGLFLLIEISDLDYYEGIAHRIDPTPFAHTRMWYIDKDIVSPLKSSKTIEFIVNDSELEIVIDSESKYHPVVSYDNIRLNKYIAFISPVDPICTLERACIDSISSYIIPVVKSVKDPTNQRPEYCMVSLFAQNNRLVSFSTNGGMLSECVFNDSVNVNNDGFAMISGYILDGYIKSTNSSSGLSIIDFNPDYISDGISYTNKNHPSNGKYALIYDSEWIAFTQQIYVPLQYKHILYDPSMNQQKLTISRELLCNLLEDGRKNIISQYDNYDTLSSSKKLSINSSAILLELIVEDDNLTLNFSSVDGSKTFQLGTKLPGEMFTRYSQWYNLDSMLRFIDCDLSTISIGLPVENIFPLYLSCSIGTMELQRVLLYIHIN